MPDINGTEFVRFAIYAVHGGFDCPKAPGEEEAGCTAQREAAGKITGRDSP
jgi:hypothetical protein